MNSSNKKVPKHLRKQLGEANAKYLSKQYADAKARCEMLIQRHPKLPDPYHLLALIYQELGHNQQALHMFKLAAKNEYGRSNYELWMHIGNFSEEIGDIDSAFEAYKIASQKIKYTKTKNDKAENETEDKPNPTPMQGLAGTVSYDFYFDCDFESYEKLVQVAEAKGDLSEATYALRFMLRTMRNPKIEHLSYLFHLLQKRKFSTNKFVLALDPWIQPLLLTKNDPRIIQNGAPPSSPSDEDLRSFKIHLNIFERFIVCLLITRQYQKALTYILRFKMFLKTPTTGRYKYLHCIVEDQLPLVFLSLQICCYIFLDKPKVSSALESQLLKIYKNQYYEEKIFFYISEAYFEKSLFDDCLRILKRTKRAGNYYFAVVYDTMGDYEHAMTFYKSVLRHKSPDGITDFKFERFFIDTIIDKKTVANRLYCLLLIHHKDAEADKLYLKYNLGDKEKLIQQVREQQEQQELIESKLPRLLDMNYILPKKRSNTETSADFGKQYTKRRKIYQPKLAPMNVGATLRKTTKNAKWLKGDLRPHTLQQISRCKHALKTNHFKECISIGLDLLYPFFGNGEKTCDSFGKLWKEFPYDETTPDTLLKDDEVMILFRLILQALIALKRLPDGVNLAVDLYKSTQFSFDKLKDNSECFGLVVYLCLLSQDFQNLGKILLTVLSEKIVDEECDNVFSIEQSKTTLLVLQYILTLYPDNKNIPRIIKRVLISGKQNKSNKYIISLLILISQHELKTNIIRCLIFLLQARKMVPTNPFINLYIAIAYLRISHSRTCNKPNKVFMQGLAYFQRYIDQRANDTECTYNKAVYYHQHGFNFLAEKLYTDTLQMKELNTSIKTQAAFGLSSIHYKSNPSKAKQILEQFVSI